MRPLPSRFLSAVPALVVANVKASVAYYRDVLGFRASADALGADEFAIVDLAPGQGVHLKRGPAPQAWRRQMSVYVLLDQPDLDRLVARLSTAGAQIVSPLREQPWGMREIGVADLDGYLLRFGADAAGRSPPGPTRVSPEVPVIDPIAAAAFCRERLGMGPPQAAADAPYFQRSHRDDVSLHWWGATPSPFAPIMVAPRNRARAGIWDVYIEVRGVDGLAAEMTARGVEIVRGPADTAYGYRDLEIVGPDGCSLCFAEETGGAP